MLSAWPQLMVWLLWADENPWIVCYLLATSKLQELQMVRVFVVAFDIIVNNPKSRWQRPIWKKKYIAFNQYVQNWDQISLCWLKSFCLVPLFASLVWLLAEKWRNAVSECFCRGRGRMQWLECPRAPDQPSDRPAGGLSQHVNSPSAFLNTMIIHTCDFPAQFYPSYPVSRDRKIRSSQTGFRLLGRIFFSMSQLTQHQDLIVGSPQEQGTQTNTCCIWSLDIFKGFWEVSSPSGAYSSPNPPLPPLSPQYTPRPSQPHPTPNRPP